MGLTAPVILRALIWRTIGPAAAVSVCATTVEDGEVAVLAWEAGAAATVEPIVCGMISIALIWGFSALGTKVILMTPSVASTLTVSTYARKGPPALAHRSKSLNSCPWTLNENTR